MNDPVAVAVAAILLALGIPTVCSYLADWYRHERDVYLHAVDYATRRDDDQKIGVRW